MRAEYTVVAPEFGIADGAALQQPDDGLPLWLAAVSLRTGTTTHGSYSATVVGAAGLSRGSAWVRGVGEAVERYALAPGDDEDLEAPAGFPDVTEEMAAHGVVGPLATNRSLLSARRLATGEPCAVPRAAVDYPGVDEDGLADQTPSGAASGLGRDRALVRATLELIERDAFERAWQGVTTPHRVDLADLGEADADTRSMLDQVESILLRHGRSVHLGVLPTITGVPAVTALVQRGDGPVGVGCAAGDTITTCAVKAIVEGIQVESLLTNWRESRGEACGHTVARPRTESERIDYLGTPAATRAAAEFAASFTSGPAPRPVPPPATSVALAGDLAAVGVQTFAVDLTPRLPERVQALGWCAVRVLSAGLQPLRGNDRLSWNWAPLRVPGRAGVDGAPTRPPHPLA